MTSLLFVFLMAVCFTFAYKGADVTEPFSSTQCFKAENVEKLIIRCYRSYGAVDPYCQHSLQIANREGMHAEVYINPCYPCGNPEIQVREMIENIKEESFEYVWILVETYKWSNLFELNQRFVLELASAIIGMGKKPGVITSKDDWEEIMGTSWTGMYKFPLWYEECDKKPTFDGFKPFGGWKTPKMKKYDCNVKTCGERLNYDFFTEF